MSLAVHLNQSEENNARSMEPELYSATVRGEILEFVIAMNGWATNRHHCLSASCIPVDPQKNTVLHLATSFRHHEIVKLLCKDLPYLVAVKNGTADTALHIAARAGDQILILFLIDSDYGDGVLGEANDAGNAPLHEALRCRHEAAARILIEKNPNIVYSANREGKSVMYLAAEAGYGSIIRLLLGSPAGECMIDEMKRDKSPLLAAILGKNTGILKLLWSKDHSWTHKRCDYGRNPLHYAANIGYTEGAEFLLREFYRFAYWRDKQGFFPIHAAAIQGRVEFIQMMLQQRPDSRELLTLQRQNVLHIAAKSGKWKAFEAMLKMPELEKLLNEKDEDGNTPLHIATICGHPKIVTALIRDERAKIELQNNDGLTVHDIAEELMKPHMASFQKRLTWMALRLASAPKASKMSLSKTMDSVLGEELNTENFRDKVNVILLVATLVATVTFTAGFTMPGGYRNGDPDQGIANMLGEAKFHIFVVCDSLAMYISIIVAVILLWAQMCDQKSMYVALKLALPPLGAALAMMSVAFTAGVYLVVSKLGWLAEVVLLLGSSFIAVLLLLFLPLCFLGSSSGRVLRSISYYPFCFMLYASGNYAGDEAED